MKKMTAAELAEIMADGGVVEREDKLAPLVAQVAQAVSNPPQVNVELGAVADGMKNMAQSLAGMKEWQQTTSEQIVKQLEVMNARTKVQLTVTKRDEMGGIVNADIEVI